MKIIKNISLFILMISSTCVLGQSVTFQSNIETGPWVEQVLLNGIPLVKTAPDTFEISASDVLPGKNVMEFVPKSLTNLNGGGVKASDLVQLRKGIAEVITLDGRSIIRADVNFSNFVGVEDLLIIINTILGLNPNGFDFDFVFIHSGLDLSNLDLFDFGFDVDKYCFDGSDIDNIDFLFEALLIGDVNGDAMLKPENGSTSEVRSDNMILSIEDEVVFADEEFEIPFSFTSNDPIEIFQLEIKNKDIFIESIDLESNEHEIYINNEIEDQTRMVLVSDNPTTNIKGTFSGTGSKNVKLSEIISISTDFENETVYSDFSTSGTSIEFGTTSIDEVITRDNLVISPNPVQDQFSIQIPSNMIDRSTFTITNSQGQVVLNKPVVNNNMVMNKSDLGVSGIYILTWTHGDKSVHKKIVVQ